MELGYEQWFKSGCMEAYPQIKFVCKYFVKEILPRETCK